MSWPHRHHHAITAGRSAAEWSSGQALAIAQLRQAAPADLVRYAANLAATAAERTERGDLSHLAIRLNEISREISGQPLAVNQNQLPQG